MPTAPRKLNLTSKQIDTATCIAHGLSNADMVLRLDVCYPTILKRVYILKQTVKQITQQPQLNERQFTIYCFDLYAHRPPPAKYTAAPIGMLKCSKCKKNKPQDAFRRLLSPNRSRARDYYCHDCRRADSNARYAANKKKDPAPKSRVQCNVNASMTSYYLGQHTFT